MTDAQEEVVKAENELNGTVKEAQATGALQTTQTVQPKNNSYSNIWSPQLVCKLSLGIGFFAIVAFALITYLISKEKRPEQILRTFGILIIIFAAVFLVIAGYSAAQITPVIGLLGTIAGYLLGRRSDPNEK
jgi:hypothetical protein